MTIDLDLDNDLFISLGAFMSGPHGPLSPWSDGASTPTDDQRRRLTAASVLDGNGAVPVGLQPTLAALAMAAAATRVHFYGGGALIEYADFLAPGHSSVALTVNRVGGVRLQDPSPTDNQVEAIADLVGWSTQRGVEFEVELPVADALVFAALVDAERHQSLLDLADGGAAPVQPITLDALGASLREPREGFFWLVNSVAQVCGTAPSGAADSVPDAVERLAGRGIVHATRRTAALAGACKELANRFLAITALIELENGRDDGRGGITRVGFTCVQAGVHDLMTIESLERGVHFETVSAATLVGYIELFGRQPDYAPRFAATHLVVPGGRAPTWSVPDTTSQELAGVPSGTEVRLLTESGGWAEVESADGWQGWLDQRWLGDLPVQA